MAAGEEGIAGDSAGEAAPAGNGAGAGGGKSGEGSVAEAKYYGDGGFYKCVLGTEVGADSQQVMFKGFEADGWQETQRRDIRFEAGGLQLGGAKKTRLVGLWVRGWGSGVRTQTHPRVLGIVVCEAPSRRVKALIRRNVKRFRGGLLFKARRLVYHSTLGLRVIKKREEGRHSSSSRAEESS